MLNFVPIKHDERIAVGHTDNLHLHPGCKRRLDTDKQQHSDKQPCQSARQSPARCTRGLNLTKGHHLRASRL